MGILPECQGLDIRLREKLKSKVEGAVLGLSYVRKLNFDKLKHHIACFAASSHDLFLDYHKLMWIYDEVVHKHGGELKYCVLGMDFYRLWYDLSMSAYKERMMCMYHKLHCVHHFHELDAALGVFHACTPDSMRKDTWDVLRELQKLYAFPILDLSEHSAFEKKHFADCAHLNDDGADLATELLNLYMDEIW